MSQPPDVFSSIRPKSEHELLEKVFCVNDWQTEITRNYISSASMFPTPRKGKRSQEVKSKENIEKPFTTNPFKSQGEFYAQTKSESREPERIVVRSLSRIGNTDNRKRNHKIRKKTRWGNIVFEITALEKRFAERSSQGFIFK